MCATCGCDAGPGVRVFGPGQLSHGGHGSTGHGSTDHEHTDHEHTEHGHAGHQHTGPGHAGHGHTGHGPGGPGDQPPGHVPGSPPGGRDAVAGQPGERTVVLQERVLAKNDSLAAANRAWLADRSILAVNLMSSPGAGKTTLLERTARDVGTELGLSVIEGDQETTLDAARIEAAGCAVAQINTGAGCHLDADMVARGLRALGPRPGSVLIIENVGNLVCPALFDLGEAARVVISSVTEGADKPLKYPQMFRDADLVLLSKVDLLPYLDFDTGRHAADLRRVSPRALLLPLSATTGEGLPAWYGWLRQHAGQG